MFWGDLMTPVEQLISRLEKVRGRNGSWTACCPAHEDRSPSLSVREAQDGRVLLHCFGGCDTESVLAAVGMTFSDLWPADRQRERLGHGVKPVKPAFYASDLLRVIDFEALVVQIAALDIAAGKNLSANDRERLRVAQQRISEAARYANV